MSRRKVSEVSIILIIIIFLSKILGFVRDMFIAGRFGAGAETDAFFIAMTASAVFFIVIGMALNTIIIPLISEAKNKNGIGGENKYVSRLITITTLFTIVLTVLCFLFTPLIIRILASGFSGAKFDLTVKLTRIGLPLMVMSGILYILKGYLHVKGNFVLPAIEGFAISLPMILYILLLSEEFGVTGLMVTVLIAGFIRLLIYIPGAYSKGFRYRFPEGIFDKDIRHTIVLMGPIVLGTLAGNINMIIDRTIASRLTEGSITALSFSHRLMSLATEMLIFTIVAVVYATVSEFQANNNQKEFNKNINFGINFVILIGIPASAGFIILGKPIVRLFYERGAFTQADTQAMVSALAFYSIGITAVCIADLLTKAMFSMKDTKTPVKISLGAAAINIVLNIILAGFMGHNGLALATSAASVFSMILLMVFFKRKSDGFVFNGFTAIVLKSTAASVVMVAVIWILFSFVFNLDQEGFLPRLGGLAAIVTIGFAVYILSVYLLKVEEVRLGILEIRKKFGKTG